MIIAKYCKPEHNIFDCDNILVGNFEKFRQIEDKNIRDELEARFRFSIKIPNPTKLSREWISTIFNGHMNLIGDARVRPPAGVEYQAFEKETRIIEMNSDDNFVLMTSEIDFFYSIPNSFIFCMSKYTEGQLPPSSEYTSRWLIEGDENIYEFGSAMSNEIFRNIIRRMSINNNPIFRDIFSRLRVLWKFDEINYTGKELYVIRKESDLSVEDFFKLLVDTPFRKRPRFAPENEVRFVFDAYLDGKPLPLDMSDVLIESAILRKFVFN